MSNFQTFWGTFPNPKVVDHSGFLPPATKLGQGYIFTGVCHSVNRGGGIPACIAGGIPTCLAAGLQGGLLLWGVSWGVPAPGGSSPGGLLPGGVWPSVMAFCCGLLLCPSVMAFWFGGLLIEGGLLVWSSGGQKAITEGHHTRRP